MKPVAIFRFSSSEGPGYFAEFLDGHGLPWDLIRIDAGDDLPKSINGYSGLCLMGGSMSVNDPLPWIPCVLQLIRSAYANDVPIIGHCLGGQLMSKALGERVCPNRVKELGWSALTPIPSDVTKKWLGLAADGALTVFQWHGETFELPKQAHLIATNSYCTNQIFALGPHLGMQCHIEMTPEMIKSWCEQWDDEKVKPSSTVQTPAEMIAQTALRLPQLRLLADNLYGNWIRPLLQEKA